MKKKILISMLILLLITISAVSASDDLDQNITQTSDIDNDIEINNDDVLGASTARTFMDLQTQIGRTEAGGTLTLEDDYAYTAGTDRTIGIAIYATTKDITIDGNGHTLDGKNAARILFVNEGATNIVIKNVNFVNGYNADGAGAIFWKGDSGTISNCNFTSNNADKSGGAIIWTGATGTIDNCKFEKCSSKSQSGGAVYTTDTSTQITISNSKFINNKAKTSAAAIASSGAKATISKSIFTDNSASDSGAAIYLTGANTKINECQFIRNSVDGSGGAIFWKGDLGTLDKCNFTANTAKDNGGAVFWATAKGIITNNRFENSVSNTQSGGAIYCNDLSTQTTLSNNVFINNTAQTCGAGIGSAGANSIISNNIFTDNIVHESGAGVYTSGKGSKINNNQFLRNKAVSGGAVYIEIDGISMDKCYFKDNYITGGGGGAMRWNGNSGTMTNCAFEDNIAATRGGAVYWNGNDAKIEKNNFTSNTANTAAGGALLYWGNNGQIISNNFNENSATQGYGGALYVDGSSTKVSNNKFDKNAAAKGGGAIYYEGASGSVTENTITSNSAENACGIRWNGDGATITSNTFKGNKNTNGANIVFGDGAKAKVTQNTFLNNKESDNCIRWNSADAVITPNTYKDDTVTKLTGSEVTAYYGGSAYLIFTLSTSTQVLSGKTVTVSFNNKNTDLTTNANGQAILDVKGTDAGTYTASAKFAGDSDYDASSASTGVNINKAPTELVLNDIKDIILGQELAMTATVNATGGTVTFDVDGNRTTLPLLSSGKAVYLFKPALGDHTYNVAATYNPSTNYLTSSASATFTVTRMPTSISGENVTVYTGGKGQLIFTLTDETTSKGMPLIEVNIVFNGQSYTQKTDSKGKITIDLANLGIGTYEASVSYTGDKIFAPSNATATAFVKATIESEDLVANYGDATYTARFVDNDGKALPEKTYVLFTIDNAPYRAPVDKNGIAKLTIDKTPGEYTITNTNPITGEETKNKITINKMPTKTTISGLKDINVGENLTATVKVNVTKGTLTIKLNDKEESVNYTGRNYNIKLNELPDGDYTFTATFKGENEYYIGSSATATFSVTKKANILTVETKDIEEGEDALFNVAASIGTGEVTLKIDGKTYTKNLTNGKASFTISNLTADTYKYTINVQGDKYYEANSTTGSINVKSTKIIIDAPDLEKYYGDSKRFVVTVSDKDKNPLKDIPLIIIINGEKYDKTTDENGETSVGINLPATNYTAEIIFKGNKDYSPVNTTSNINIKTTIIGSDVVKIEKSPVPYVATFLDSTGKYLPDGEHVYFNINGVFYDRTVENGQAKLNLNLEPKTYIITAINSKTGEQTANSVTIKPRIVNNSDVTKYFKNDTQYEVTLLDDNGNPVKAGQTVTFNINGVFYSRTTDAKGIAKLSINLEPKDYIITAEYKNCRVSNNIKVLPVLTAKDITMTDKKRTQFKANLVDGQGRPYAGQTITFNVNGVFYYRTTDETGTAGLNINLMAGKYIITSSYNGSNIANTITINP